MEIKKVLVVGAGQMGNGIAQVMLQGGMNVFMQDIDQNFVDKGMANIEKNLAKMVEQGKLTAADKDVMYKRLCGVVELDEAVCKVDLVVEAVVENMKVKKRHLPKTRRALPAADDSGKQHVFAAGYGYWRDDQTPGTGLRHAFLQPGAAHGAGGSRQQSGDGSRNSSDSL